MIKFAKTCLIMSVLLAFASFNASAAVMKGNIQYLTNKFKTFLLVEEGTGKTEIFKFGKNTPSLQPNDFVAVTYSERKMGKGIAKATKVEKLFKGGGVSPAVFKQLQASGAVVIDVRNNKDAKKGIINGAIHIPLNKLEGQLGSLDKSKKTVVYCNSGPIAAIAYNILKNNGFNNSNYLAARVRFRKGKLSIN